MTFLNLCARIKIKKLVRLNVKYKFKFYLTIVRARGGW